MSFENLTGKFSNIYVKFKSRVLALDTNQTEFIDIPPEFMRVNDVIPFGRYDDCDDSHIDDSIGLYTLSLV